MAHGNIIAEVRTMYGRIVLSNRRRWEIASTRKAYVEKQRDIRTRGSMLTPADLFVPEIRDLLRIGPNFLKLGPRMEGQTQFSTAPTQHPTCKPIWSVLGHKSE